MDKDSVLREEAIPINVCIGISPIDKVFMTPFWDIDDELQAIKIDLDILRLLVEVGKIEHFDYLNLVIALCFSTTNSSSCTPLALTYLCKQGLFEFCLDLLLAALLQWLRGPDLIQLSSVLSILRTAWACGDKYRCSKRLGNALFCMTVHIATSSTFENADDQGQQFNAAVISFCLFFKRGYTLDPPSLRGDFLSGQTRKGILKEILLDSHFTCVAYFLALVLCGWKPAGHADDDKDINKKVPISLQIYNFLFPEDNSYYEHISHYKDATNAIASTIDPLDDSNGYMEHLPNIPGAWIEESKMNSLATRKILSTSRDFISVVNGRFWEPDVYLHIENGDFIPKDEAGLHRSKILKKFEHNFDCGRRYAAVWGEYTKRWREYFKR